MSVTARNEVSSRPIRQEERDRFAKESPVSSLLPLLLPDGVTVCELTGDCIQCGKPIREDLFRGSFSEIGGVVTLEAQGNCLDCQLVTRFRWRFRPDGTIDSVNKNGEWVRSKWIGKNPVRRVYDQVRSLARTKGRRLLIEAAVAAAFLLPILALLLVKR